MIKVLESILVGFDWGVVGYKYVVCTVTILQN